MAAELSVGMKVMRRFKGGVWAEGFVTALEPTACMAVDRASFAAMYEDTILSLDKLTAHQAERLSQLLNTEEDGHLLAPAGAGKTFVAVQFLLHQLRHERDTVCLFVARNVALCLFVVRWLCARRELESAVARRD